MNQCMKTFIMEKVTCAVLLLIATSVMDSHAQTTIALDVPRVVPISPTAAAMEKYQSYPVDHSTGIPNISIPLYEIVAGEVTIPVSLSYHASGLKPKEASTYAGTGWTLNLEPSVTRQICGLADDAYYGWFNDPNRGYNPSGTGDPMIDYYNQLVDNIRDTQPDKFSYKLANGSGSGYFQDGINFLSIPRNNDKVEYHNADGIRIKDARGVKYLFDGEREKVEDYTTRWMCKSIWSPNNPNHALIDFSYTTLPNNYSLGHYYNLNDKVIITRSRNGNNIKNIFTVDNHGYNDHYFIEPTQGSPDAQLRPISESEVSPEGKKVHASHDKIKKYIKDFANMEAVVTSVTFRRDGKSSGIKWLIVRINGEEYMMQFIPKEFQQLSSLKVNDKIIVRSRSAGYSPNHPYLIITGDYIERNNKVLFKRDFSENKGC